jgi:hypothetical protein
MLLRPEGGMAFCVFVDTIGIDRDTQAMSFALNGSPLREVPRSGLCRIYHCHLGVVGSDLGVAARNNDRSELL